MFIKYRDRSAIKTMRIPVISRKGQITKIKKIITKKKIND